MRGWWGAWVARGWLPWGSRFCVEQELKSGGGVRLKDLARRSVCPWLCPPVVPQAHGGKPVAG